MKRNVFFLSLMLIASPLTSSCQKEKKIESNNESSVNKELVLQLINTYRTSDCDCGSAGNFAPATPVIWNDTLELAAIVHSSDMFANNFFSHTGSDGSNMSERIKRLGYNWTTCGENIGKGYKNEEQMVTGWINSPGHCSNIMNPNFREIGAAKIGDYWTLVLGTR